MIFSSFKSLAQKFESTGTKDNGEEEMLLLLQRTIRRANRCVPWKNKCLVGVLTARKYLNQMNYASEASLGVRKQENGDLIAHSWITSGGVEIVEKEQEYKELYRF